MTVDRGPVASADPLTRLAVCEVTLSPVGLDDRIGAVAAAGVPGYGPFRLLHDPALSGADLRSRLDAAGLKPSFGVTDPFSVGPMRMFSPVAGRRELLGMPDVAAAEAAIMADLRWYGEVEPVGIIVLAGGQGDASRADAWQRAAESLQRIDLEAQRLGLPTLLEFISPRYAGDSDLIESIDDARRMLDDIGGDNMSLLLDAFHVWELDDLPGQIARAAGRIGGVHLSDSSRFPRSVVDRLPPGQGDIDLVGFISAIERTGYSGWYELEVVSDDGTLGGYGFPDSWWRRTPAEMLTACIEGFISAYQAASKALASTDGDR